MKKIDFHMHTVATFSDADFEFSLETLKRYVDEADLHAIAITNHDIFDSEQFQEIRESLDIVVFPGIEINLERGHLLLISDDENLGDFKAKADQVSAKINRTSDCISVEELESIYGDLGHYLLIPHYEKGPRVRTETLEKLGEHIFSGEVQSAKKFVCAAKDPAKLTPVLFSDERISTELEDIPIRQTFIDCGDLTISAIKQCLKDKGKVTLSEKDGNGLFPVIQDGPAFSTGLNVLLGARSSGKTFTLDKIDALNENTKYIRQFQLVQQDTEKSKKEFKNNINTQRSLSADKYLAGFKGVVDQVIDIDLRVNDKEVEAYIASLIKSGEEADREDNYSKMGLFNETRFKDKKEKALKELIDSVQHIIENQTYRKTIEQHIELIALKKLICDLIEQLWAKAHEFDKKNAVDDIVKNVKIGLKRKSSSEQIEDVDLFEIAMDAKRIDRFEEIVNFLKADFVIDRQNIQSFSVVVHKEAFTGAQDVKNFSIAKVRFTDAYKKYASPYEYLQELKEIEDLPDTELYKLFAKVNYKILNQDEEPVSGGERSEFRLLQEINDAHRYEMLLIDEPESSFDNVFLNSNVNQIIREISEVMPVVVVTHNSTLGASIGANYLLYASKERDDFGDLDYKLYAGYPGDKELTAVDGSKMSNHEIMMNSLEAGEISYEERRRNYATIKD